MYETIPYTHSMLGSIKCSSSQGGVKGKKTPPATLELTYLWLVQHRILYPLRRLVTNKYFSNSSSTNAPFSIPRYFSNRCFKSGGKEKSGHEFSKINGRTFLFPLQCSVQVNNKAFEPSIYQNYYFFLE